MKLFFDMGPVQVEGEHTPWEAVSSVWELLGGSRLLEKGLGSLNKHLAPMSTPAQCATLVLSEAE